jgi:hypothetical protein
MGGMKLSRSEIDAEAAKILEGRNATPYHRAAVLAFLEHVNELPMDQICPDCNGIVSVEQVNTAWLVSCPCGRTKETLRGL